MANFKTLIEELENIIENEDSEDYEDSDFDLEESVTSNRIDTVVDAMITSPKVKNIMRRLGINIEDESLKQKLVNTLSPAVKIFFDRSGFKIIGKAGAKKALKGLATQNMKEEDCGCGKKKELGRIEEAIKYKEVHKEYVPKQDATIALIMGEFSGKDGDGQYIDAMVFSGDKRKENVIRIADDANYVVDQYWVAPDDKYKDVLRKAIGSAKKWLSSSAAQKVLGKMKKEDIDEYILEAAIQKLYSKKI